MLRCRCFLLENDSLLLDVVWKNVAKTLLTIKQIQDLVTAAMKKTSHS